MGTSVRSNPSAFARKWFFHGARKVSFTNSERKADGGGVIIVGMGGGRAVGKGVTRFDAALWTEA